MKKITLTEKQLHDIIKEAIEKALNANSSEENNDTIEQSSDDFMDKAMDAMNATLQEQDKPKVGIFWYSPNLNDVFGVVAIDAETAPISGGGLRTCKELHKNIWKRNFNYNKFHNIKSEFVGDYKYTPRGRIFYDEETDEYSIMVGHWINDYPTAKQCIRSAFNLEDKNLVVRFKYGDHWELGMGYGD